MPNETELTGRDKAGKATFTRDQVEEIKELQHNDNLDYDSRRDIYDNDDIQPDGRR